MINFQCSMDKVGSYEFLAEPFHCDFSQRLFMGHLGNHMLNAADFHSSARGFGMKYLMTINRSWVLSRLAIEMDEMPQQYTKFNVETWVESAMRYFISRNFRVVGDDGHVYGYGRSIWAMIDTESRQPTDIFSIDNGAINNWIVKDKECPIDKGGRVNYLERTLCQHSELQQLRTYFVDSRTDDVTHRDQNRCHSSATIYLQIRMTKYTMPTPPDKFLGSRQL